MLARHSMRRPVAAWATAATLVMVAASAQGAPVAAEISPPPYPPAPAATPQPSEPTSPLQTQPAEPAPPPAAPPPSAAPPAAPPFAPGYAPAPASPWARPPEWRPPPEGGIAVAQIGLGSLTMVLSVAVLAALANNESSGAAAGLTLMATPALTGFVACWIGGRSSWYRGGCAPPVVGAYLGLLTTVPLAFAGCQLAGGDRDSDCFGGAVLGFVVGLLVGPAVGATVGWHIFKEPRFDLGYGYAPPPTASSAGAAPSPRATLAETDASLSRRGGLAPLGVRLTVPLLSMGF